MPSYTITLTDAQVSALEWHLKRLSTNQRVDVWIQDQVAREADARLLEHSDWVLQELTKRDATYKRNLDALAKTRLAELDVADRANR